uniref:Uncharacterized protein n=1 Tax=Plectus sambesii TaxID=2011161 RepID=A0A914UW03_9BILA
MAAIRRANFSKMDDLLRRAIAIVWQFHCLRRYGRPPPSSLLSARRPPSPIFVSLMKALASDHLTLLQPSIAPSRCSIQNGTGWSVGDSAVPRGVVVHFLVDDVRAALALWTMTVSGSLTNGWCRPIDQEAPCGGRCLR